NFIYYNLGSDFIHHCRAAIDHAYHYKGSRSSSNLDFDDSSPAAKVIFDFVMSKLTPDDRNLHITAPTQSDADEYYNSASLTLMIPLAEGLSPPICWTWDSIPLTEGQNLKYNYLDPNTLLPGNGGIYVANVVRKSSNITFGAPANKPTQMDLKPSTARRTLIMSALVWFPATRTPEITFHSLQQSLPGTARTPTPDSTMTLGLASTTARQAVRWRH
ncbi:unnamed protein product, partial [Fusarium fujikuroi]